MKILAFHDHLGTTTAVVIGPQQEAPAAGLALPGHLATMVEAPELPANLEQEEGQQRLVELLRHSRVELGHEARLVAHPGGRPRLENA